MALLDRSTLYFAMVFVGGCVLFAGVGGFLALHDQDWKYAHAYADDEYPQNEGNVVYYDTLPPAQQHIVDDAIDGKTFYLETEDRVPPDVVRKNDTYHVFERFTVFDFSDPGTTGPAFLGVAGLVLMVDGARRDVRS